MIRKTLEQKALEQIQRDGRPGIPPENYRKVRDFWYGWAWYCNNKSLFSGEFDFGLYKTK